MTYRLSIISLHLAIFFALLFGYEHYIVPIYGYEGYLFEPNEAKFIATLGFTLLLSLITPIDHEKPSTLFLNVSFIFVLLPMLVLFYAANKPWLYTLQVFAAYVVLILMLPLVKLESLRLPSLDNSKLLRVLLLLATLYIVSVFLMGGGAYFNLDISKVYDIRSDAAENLPGIFGYISPLVGKIFLPFALLLALTLRKYLFALLSVGLSVLVFGLTAHKGPLFYPFLIIFVYVLLSRRSLIRSFCLAIFFVLCLSIADFWLYQTSDNPFFGWTGSLMMRRVFILPADINYMYYDFFSINDWVLWSNSKLALGSLHYRYALDPSHLIGLEYFNNEETGANTGWLGSGYMQAGFFGILLYTAVISFVFSFIDGVARKVEDPKLVIAGMIVPIFSLITSTDLPTAILTHGLLLNLILISLIKNKDLRHA